MLKLYFLLVLAAVLFLSCIAIGFVDENSIDACGGERYTSVGQICEDEIIKTKCGTGNGYHNPATQFCNGNDVVDKCGGKDYDTSIEGCFIDIIRPKCGEDIFDPSIQACVP
jgi:hypothetical protein